QVAVNDALLMSMLYRVTDGDKQSNPLVQREPLGIAVTGDGHTIDHLHGKVGQARGCSSRVQDTRDVGMLHDSQGLPLAFKASDHLFAVHARLDDLERNVAADRLVLLRAVHNPHATLAELLDELVRPDLSA